MAKADFDHIYTADDPRQYFRTLSQFGYEIPAHAATVFSQVAQAVAVSDPPHIVDLCCSYGVNATVFNHDLDFDDVVERYCDPALDTVEPDELADLDRDFYRANISDGTFRFTGVDVAQPAIDYAANIGLLDAGFAEDLEQNEPTPELAADLRTADLITVCGGIGYITEKTLDRVFTHAERPRLAALCLRWIDFAPIVAIGAAHGLVTERLEEATFPQRRFADDIERRHAEAELARLGIDGGGRESEGWHHTDFYLLRPAEEAAARPLASLLEPSGAIGDDGRPVDVDDVGARVITVADAWVEATG
ncbi:MAG: hypothetical protein ACR2H3_11360 [Acidimicrobiales bacterium]